MTIFGDLTSPIKFSELDLDPTTLGQILTNPVYRLADDNAVNRLNELVYQLAPLGYRPRRMVDIPSEGRVFFVAKSRYGVTEKDLQFYACPNFWLNRQMRW